MSIIVQKFGGTSIADAEKIHRAARRAIKTKLDGHQVVMTVSAMGKTTDKLVALANQVNPNPPKREIDMLLTTGEQVSISLMAMAIAAAGHEAISFTGGQIGMVTDSAHTKARIQSVDADRIHRHLDEGKIVIVAGFQGITEEGAITTLGRGGSDTTAVALAAVLKADACEVYTDVDGVYTTDPRIVPQARKMHEITYDEMLELASLGAGVMHSRSMEFGKKYNVPIHVRSSLTDSKGTMIVPETTGMEEIVVRGVTLKRDMAVVVLIGVPNKPGIASQIFARIAKHNIIVDDIIQNVYEHGHEANIGFSTSQSDVKEAGTICEEMAKDIGFKQVEVDENVAKVSIVGIGMKSHTGVAAKMFTALAKEKINIQNIATSEIVISCIIDQKDGERALQALHATFELDKNAD
ncbi:MAG: aspartate kinase [Planctomycetota bacterium]|nr:MAG: aspartate kinase [Planctomycetota bacterium]